MTAADEMAGQVVFCGVGARGAVERVTAVLHLRGVAHLGLFVWGEALSDRIGGGPAEWESPRRVREN